MIDRRPSDRVPARPARRPALAASSRVASLPRAGLGALALLLLACPTKRSPPPADANETQDVASSPVASGADASESDHHVVFADRTSQSYVLLLPPTPATEPAPQAPTRDELAALVRERLSAAEDEPEVALLLELIATEPRPTLADPSLGPEERETLRHEDLLGLHVDLQPMTSPSGETLISPEVLRDPISTRDMEPQERESIPTRSHALVLRAHYRNRFGLRGLRLLQTLVRVVALDRGALVHDPDTGETMGVEAFTRRRLQSTVGNVADQIVVLPFPDERNGDGQYVRLSTRGMRRFGSVDLELDGLPAEQAALQAASHLIMGLAYRMARMGEYDQEGYAVEVDDVIELERLDITRAYAGRRGKVPQCEGCPQRIELHLVERPAEPHDPVDHVVARIVAPREDSDAPGYDHPAWVRSALSDLLGVPQ